ncbi:hypothetical protein R0K05_09435 [Planococcus sp. SIMBA_160]
MKKWHIGLMVTAVLLAGCGEEKAEQEATESANTSEQVIESEDLEVPEYSIVEMDVFEDAGIIRRDYWVLPDDIFISEEQIELMITDVVDEAKNDGPYNSVLINVIDDERSIDELRTFAEGQHSPYGNWARSSEVEAGDYSNHKLVIELGSVRSGQIPADYEEGPYPTEEELDVFYYILDKVREERASIDPEEFFDEEKFVREAAEELSISYEEAQDTVNKVRGR